MDPEIRTQVADRRQAFSGGQGSSGDQPRQLLLQLCGDRDGRVAVEHDAHRSRRSLALDLHHSVISLYNSQSLWGGRLDEDLRDEFPIEREYLHPLAAAV